MSRRRWAIEHPISEVLPDALQTEPGDAAESTANSLVRRSGRKPSLIRASGLRV